MNTAGASMSEIAKATGAPQRKSRPGVGHFVVALVLLTLGFFLIWPIILLLINSFNTAADWLVEPRRWGFDHWLAAFEKPGVFRSLYNSILIWGMTMAISFPVGTAIAWVTGGLGRRAPVAACERHEDTGPRRPDAAPHSHHS